MVVMSADCALQAGLGGAAPVPATTAGKPVGMRFTFGSSLAASSTTGAGTPSESAAAQAPVGPSAVEGAAASGSRSAANRVEVSMFYNVSMCPICHHLMLACSFGMVFNATIRQ